MSLIPTFLKEVQLTIARPSRAAGLLDARALRRLKHRVIIGLNPERISDGWSGATLGDDAEGIKQRSYVNYEQYLAHQRAKLQHLDLEQYDTLFRSALAERIETLIEAGTIDSGARVLCLGARIGTEVKAFIDKGCFAIGIDLNPGEENRYVVIGDFHDLQYANASVDVVYSNALDHVFELERVASEVHRVLRPGGLFLVDAERGSEEGMEPEFYESFWWRSTRELCERLETMGFEKLGTTPITIPWKGDQLRLRRV